MTTRTALLADIARCHGRQSEPICQRCARREQMNHDAPTRYYPYMDWAPVMGRCVYHIEEVRNA